MKIRKGKNSILVDSLDIEILPFADWHIGSSASDMPLIKQAIAYVAKTKKCFAIIDGDLMETNTYHSKGLVHQQKLTGTDQYKTLKELLWPIRHKILYAVTGNHEKRIVKETTTDIMAVFCGELGIEYCGYEKHFLIKMQDRIVRCYMHHNTGGGTTAGAKINRLISLHFRSPFSDVVFSGHTHDLSDAQKLIVYQDRTGNIKTKRQWFISCGSALGSDVGYACENAYPPIPTGFKIVEIHYNKHINLPEIKIRLIQ